jgi:hypothetical protein
MNFFLRCFESFRLSTRHLSVQGLKKGIKVAAKLSESGQPGLLYSKNFDDQRILAIFFSLFINKAFPATITWPVMEFCGKTVIRPRPYKVPPAKKGGENWKRLELLTIFAGLVDTRHHSKTFCK